MAVRALLTFALIAWASAESITPVEKVLEMLGEMKAKGEAGLVEEQKTFAEYAKWVDDTSWNLVTNIKTAKAEIEELIAFIGEAENTVARLAGEIKQLEADIASMEGDLASATKVRADERAEFEAVQQDYSESVDALNRAIQVLSAQDFDREQASAMLQKMATSTPGMERVLAAFLQMQNSQDGAPAVSAYKFQSGGIVALLEKLHEKFSGELADVEKEEANKAHNYNLLKIKWQDDIAYYNKDKEQKSEQKAKTAAESAEAQGKLADTKDTLAQDEATLAEVKATFASKSSTFENNQKVRKDELEALGKATEIIAEGAAGNYKEHVKLVQTGVSLLQLSSARARSSSVERAQRFLERRAASLKSESLGNLAQQLLANPFEKVIGMIENLIDKLKEEAAAEADHKAWCDEQLKANKLKREKKTSKRDELVATIEKYTSDIQNMANEIARLIQHQEDLTKEMAEQTAIREKENAFNTKTIADSKAGAEAVKRALDVLREFYSSQAGLIQQVPEMAEYKGQQNAKGGVIGMLEVILSDFEREVADHTAAEAQAKAEYDTFMKDSAASKKAAHKEEVQLKLDKDQAEFEKGNTEKDLDATQEELDRAIKYYEYLKPNCLEVHVSYEERVAQRKQEIEALKEAYGILDQKNPGTL